jgi:hypothetical protein
MPSEGNGQPTPPVEEWPARPIARIGCCELPQPPILARSAQASRKGRLFAFEVERDLQQVGFRSVTILRRMFIDGDRGEFRFGEAAVLQFCKLFGPLLPRGFRVNPASVIAEAAIKAVMSPKEGVHFIYSQDLTSNPT